MNEHIDIPSNPADQDAIRKTLNEMAKVLGTIEDQREQLKEMADALKDSFAMKPKLSRELATAIHKHNYNEKQQHYENFEAAYEILVEGRKVQD